MRNRLEDALMRNPFLPVVVAFCAGLVVTFRLECAAVHVGWFVGLALLITIWIVRYRANIFLTGGVVLVLFTALGFVWGKKSIEKSERHISYTAQEQTTDVHMQLRQIRELRKTKFGYYSWYEVVAILQDEQWVSSEGKIMAYLPASLFAPVESYIRDSYWIARGKVSPLPDSASGYVQYLRQSGLTHKVNVAQMELLDYTGWSFPFARMQFNLGKRLDTYLADETTIQLAKAMLLGDRSGMDQEIRVQYADSGVAHILALSGLHISLLALLAAYLTGWLPLGRYYPLQMLAVLVLMFAYAAITGLSPSVVRAVFMASMFLGARLLFVRAQILNVIAFCAFIQLLIQPLLIHSLSFQLSYLAVLGIVTLGKSLISFGRQLWPPLRYVWVMAAVSIAAQVFTLPVILYNFEQFPVYFLPANLLLLPLVTLFLPVGMMLLMLGGIPFLGAWVASAFTLGMKLMHVLTGYIVSLPYATVSVSLSEMQAWLLMGGVLLLTGFVAFWVEQRKRTDDSTDWLLAGL